MKIARLIREYPAFFALLGLFVLVAAGFVGLIVGLIDGSWAIGTIAGTLVALLITAATLRWVLSEAESGEGDEGGAA